MHTSAVSVGGQGSRSNTKFVLNQPAWATRLLAVLAVAGVAAGVAMTIASGGRGDTPLIAFGPMTVLFGIGMGFLALSSRQGQVAVDDTSYTVRGGLPTKTTTLVFSDAAMVRGGAGEYLGYLVVTDQQGQRIRIGLQRGTAEMKAHIAVALLESGAVIDPECATALHQLAGQAMSDVAPSLVAQTRLRLDRRGRLRWRRGTFNTALIAIMCIPLGGFWLVDAAPGVPRWVGWPILLIGLAAGTALVRGRLTDKRNFRQRHS